LDETFSIFGRHFWRFIGLVAATQVPISVVSLLLLQVLDEGSYTLDLASFTFAFVLGLFGTMFAYGAVVYAVGQQYVTNGITIRSCYERAWWRVMSLVALTAIMAATMSILVLGPSLTDQVLVLALATMMAVLALALAIYWSMAVQVVIVEGYKAVGALRRSFALIRGSWWRFFGITVVLSLAALGLGILASIPFAVALGVSGADQGSAQAILLLFLAEVIVRVTVLPVIFIAGTLLYYDLRVRNDSYDFATLSRELGIVTAV
jgi:hypothetical protein